MSIDKEKLNEIIEQVDAEDDTARAHSRCLFNRLDAVNIFVDQYEMRDTIIEVAEQYDIPEAKAAYAIEVDILEKNGLSHHHIPNSIQHSFPYGLEDEFAGDEYDPLSDKNLDEHVGDESKWDRVETETSTTSAGFGAPTENVEQETSGTEPGVEIEQNTSSQTDNDTSLLEKSKNTPEHEFFKGLDERNNLNSIEELKYIIGDSLKNTYNRVYPHLPQRVKPYLPDCFDLPPHVKP